MTAAGSPEPHHRQERVGDGAGDFRASLGTTKGQFHDGMPFSHAVRPHPRRPGAGLDGTTLTVPVERHNYRLLIIDKK